MATTKLILSGSQSQIRNNSLDRSVFTRYSHQKRTVLFSTSKTINKDYWDERSQKVKRSYPGSERLNILLGKKKQHIEDIANDILISGGNPTVDLVKSIYNQQREGQAKQHQYTFFEYAEVFIEQSKSHKKLGTIKTYRTTINRLRDFERFSRVRLDWSVFDIDWYYSMRKYYTVDLGLTNNGFGRLIKVLKAILNDATEKGYNTNIKYRHRGFKAVREEVNNIYLNEQELQAIIKLDLKDKPRLDKARDLFIFGCYTGLRFSDFSQFKRENISGNIIKIKTQKTDQWVTIPLLDPVKDILRKYNNLTNGLPKCFNNQTMNKHLKEIGRRAWINEKVLKIRNSGIRRIEKSIPKCKLISTHTARRSFATNMFKRGVPSRVIMAITGHKTERAFSSYIKITNDENAELLLRYFEKGKTGTHNRYSDSFAR